MEIHFQQPEQEFAIPGSKMSNKFKGRSRSSGQNNKYVGVRQRPSGRWVAEIKDTTQKIRMWLGTFETAEEAARAYDEAACLLRGSNTRTNFVPQQISPDSPLASRIKTLLNKRKNAKVPQSNTDMHESSGATPSPANSVSVNNCIASSSNSAASSPVSSSGEYDSSSNDSVISFEQKTPDGHLFDDAYKPDLSNCCAKGFEMEMGPSYHDQTHIPSSGLQAQGFDHRFAFSTTQDHHQLLQLPKLNESGLPEIANHHMELSEFERMKVERQISASLYAMNGVQEYMETVLDPIEALWDLPPLCSLLC